MEGGTLGLRGMQDSKQPCTDRVHTLHLGGGRGNTTWQTQIIKNGMFYACHCGNDFIDVDSG